MANKTVYVGLEGSGKSLYLARMSVELVYRNARWYRITGIERPIVSNMWYSEEFIRFAASKHVPIIHWSNLDELVNFRECDLFIDELATYFDSRTFKDLPLDVRLWLAQAQRLGVHIYGAAQDFAQVDVSFRRLCDRVIEVRKHIGSPRPMKTAPRVRIVWGLMTTRVLDPRSYTGEQAEMRSSLLTLRFSLIKRSDVHVFDTNERIRLSEPPELKHVARRCPVCRKVVIKHV